MTVGEPYGDAEGSSCFGYKVKDFPLWDRTAERRNASAPPPAAAEAKRAEAERKAIADAQKIVAIWNARQAGGRALWFYPTIGAAIAAGVPWLSLSCPACQRVRRGGSAHARSASARVDLEPCRCRAGGAARTRRSPGSKC